MVMSNSCSLIAGKRSLSVSGRIRMKVDSREVPGAATS